MGGGVGRGDAGRRGGLKLGCKANKSILKISYSYVLIVKLKTHFEIATWNDKLKRFQLKISKIYYILSMHIYFVNNPLSFRTVWTAQLLANFLQLWTGSWHIYFRCRLQINFLNRQPSFYIITYTIFCPEFHNCHWLGPLEFKNYLYLSPLPEYFLNQVI